MSVILPYPAGADTRTSLIGRAAGNSASRCSRATHLGRIGGVYSLVCRGDSDTEEIIGGKAGEEKRPFAEAVTNPWTTIPTPQLFPSFDR